MGDCAGRGIPEPGKQLPGFYMPKCLVGRAACAEAR